MARSPHGKQIAIYPNEVVRKLIEEEAEERFPGTRAKPLGPTVLAVLVEHFKRKKKL